MYNNHRGRAAKAAGDWRTHLPPDYRERIIDKIVDTLKRHSPSSGQEGLEELKRKAMFFEKKTYAASTSQPDYLRGISHKIMSMDSQSPNAIHHSLTSNPSSNNNRPPDSGDSSNWRPTATLGVEPSLEASGDWRTQLPPDSRQRTVNKMMVNIGRFVEAAFDKQVQGNITPASSKDTTTNPAVTDFVAAKGKGKSKANNPAKKRASEGDAGGAAKRSKSEGKAMDLIVDESQPVEEQTPEIAVGSTSLASKLREAIVGLSGPVETVTSEALYKALKPVLPLHAERANLQEIPLKQFSRNMVDKALTSLSEALFFDSEVDSLVKLQSRVDSLEGQLGNKKQELKEASSSLSTARSKLDKLSREFTDYKVSTGKQIEKLEQDKDSVEKELSVAKDDLTQWKNSVGEIIRRSVEYARSVFEACKEKAPQLTEDVFNTVPRPNFTDLGSNPVDSSQEEQREQENLGNSSGGHSFEPNDSA